MPDVRRYLSAFWGPLMMLLKRFYYLSDGRALLVEDLWPPEVSKKLLNRPKSAPTCAIGKIFIFFVRPLRGQESFLRPPHGTSELFWVKSVEFCKNRVSADIWYTLPSTFASGVFAIFSILVKNRF